MKPVKTCDARRQGDQMQCRCGLAWDVKDAEPPECPKLAVGNSTMAEVRNVLQGPDYPKLELLQLKEMPLRHLPAYGLSSGLYLVDWPTEPVFALALVSRMVDHVQGRGYLFISKAGTPLVELQIREDSTGRTAWRRNVMGPIPGEWVTA